MGLRGALAAPPRPGAFHLPRAFALLLPRRGGGALSTCDRSNSFHLSDVCLLQEDFPDPRVGPGDPSAYQCPLGVPLLGLDLPGPGADAQQMLVKQSPGVLSLQPREELSCIGTKVWSLRGGKESPGCGVGAGVPRPLLCCRGEGGPSLGLALPFRSPHLPRPLFTLPAGWPLQWL